MSATATKLKQNVRPLLADDLEKVIAIDRAHSGHNRRSFFEKRFAAVKSKPDDFVHVAVMRDSVLCGFATARILRGEFGREHTVAVLDGLGVGMESQERGVGQALMSALAQRLRDMGVQSLQSQALWTNQSLVRFFAASGFALAPRFALERSVVEPLVEVPEDV